MKKLDSSKVMETIGQEWIFVTVNEAVEACRFLLHSMDNGAERGEIVHSNRNV